MPHAAAAVQHAGQASVARAGGRPDRGAPGGHAVPLGRAQPASVALRQAALCLLFSRVLDAWRALGGPRAAGSLGPTTGSSTFLDSDPPLRSSKKAGRVILLVPTGQWPSGQGPTRQSWRLQTSPKGDCVFAEELTTFTNMGWPSIALLHRCYSETHTESLHEDNLMPDSKYIAVFDMQT
eukprot:SM000043S15891  [mRNA]  locus=s43:778721:781056:- [translate_table: standard]